MQVDPVTNNIDGHADLKPEGPLGIEPGQDYQKTHCACPVCELVEHSPKLGTLVEVSGSMAIESIKQGTDDVAPCCHGIMSWHIVKGNQCQNDSAIACKKQWNTACEGQPLAGQEISCWKVQEYGT